MRMISCPGGFKPYLSKGIAASQKACGHFQRHLGRPTQLVTCGRCWTPCPRPQPSRICQLIKHKGCASNTRELANLGGTCPIGQAVRCNVDTPLWPGELPNALGYLREACLEASDNCQTAGGRHARFTKGSECFGEPHQGIWQLPNVLRSPPEALGGEHKHWGASLRSRFCQCASTLGRA